MTRLPLICVLLFFCQAAQAECSHIPKPWRHAFSELCAKELTHSRPIADFAGKMTAINKDVNRTPYVDSNIVFGKYNYWAAPSEFYQWGGMCREFAVAKYYRLAQLGVAERDMRVDVVHLKSGQDHAVLEVLYDGNVYVLDNRDNELHPQAYLDTMHMLFALNRMHVWKVIPDNAAN